MWQRQILIIKVMKMDGKIMYFAYVIGDEFVIPDGVEKVYKNGLYLYEDGLAKGTGTVIVGEDRVKFF